VKVQTGVGVAVLMSVIVKMRKVHSGVGDTDVSCGIDGKLHSDVGVADVSDCIDCEHSP